MKLETKTYSDLNYVTFNHLYKSSKIQEIQYKLPLARSYRIKMNVPISVECFQWCVYRIAGELLKHISKLVGIQWELRGGDILRVERGAVIVANHQSCIDILGK